MLANSASARAGAQAARRVFEFRSWRNFRRSLTVGLICGVLPPIGLVLMIFPAHQLPLGLLTGAVSLVAVGLRASRLRLVMDDVGVLVTTFWDTSRFRWREVEEISAARSSPGLLLQTSPAFRSGRYLVAVHAAAVLDSAAQRELVMNAMRALPGVMAFRFGLPFAARVGRFRHLPRARALRWRCE